MAGSLPAKTPWREEGASEVGEEKSRTLDLQGLICLTGEHVSQFWFTLAPGRLLRARGMCFLLFIGLISVRSQRQLNPPN